MLCVALLILAPAGVRSREFTNGRVSFRKLCQAPEDSGQRALAVDHFIVREREDEVFGKGAHDPEGHLAVVVLVSSDTVSEMQKKVKEYLSSGVRSIWIVEPATKSVTIYRSRQDLKVFTQDQEIDGRDVIPRLPDQGL